MFKTNPIDVPMLVRKAPVLTMVQNNRLSWNELGESLLGTGAARSREMRRANVFDITARGGAGSAAVTVASAARGSWAEVKSSIHRLLATDEPEYAEIRKRLKGGGHSSTLYVLSTLSLWLAGRLSLPLSVTTPVAATILYAIAGASVDYNILLDN